MMPFHAQLLTSTEGAHLYRIIMDGGAKCAFLVLDTHGGRVSTATQDGEPLPGLRLSLRDGELESSADGDETPDESPQMSREEFALISGSIRRGWLNEGSPPAKVTKYYG